MTKVRITHLKAPWPQGAQVGDVVELDGMPAWAVGKCVRVSGDEPPAEPSTADAVQEAVKLAREEAAAVIATMQAEHAQAMEALQAEHQAALAVLQGKLDQAGADAQALSEKLASTEAALAAAAKPSEPKGKGGR